MAGYTILGLLLALGSSLVLLHVARTYLKLRHIPGPFWAKFTDLQRVYFVKTGLSHRIHLDAHEKHGSLVRLGPNMVSVSDPGAIPQIYPPRPGFVKSKFYDAFIPFTKTGSMPAIFTTQDENLHKQLKSPIASLYSLSNVIPLEKFVDQVTGILFEQLDARFVESQKTFDLGDWLQYFSFEVMGTMTFSKRYGFLETGADVNGMLEAIWGFMLGIAPMTQIPWFDKLWNKNSFAILFKKGTGNTIVKVAADSANERKAMMNEKGLDSSKAPGEKDLLSRFLEIQSASTTTPPWAPIAWTFSNVIAGSDSTASVMKTAVYHILANRDTHRKLLEELAAAKLSRPYPQWSEVCDLPYLDACVNEAIRIHPPFCLQFERIVPSGGITLSGQFLPGGSIVGMNPYVVNRHKSTYGEDSDNWRPERWLNLPEEKRKQMDQGIMTFGAGRRVCLGKNIAMLEIKKIIPALLVNYKCDMTDPNALEMENSYFFRQRGINVKIARAS